MAPFFIGNILSLLHAYHFLVQALDDALFEPGNITLGDPQQIRHLFLRALRLVVQPKAQFHNALFPRGQLLQRLLQQLPVYLISKSRLMMSDSVPRMSESNSSLPSQSTLSGSSNETSSLSRLARRKCMRISFSMQRDA